MTKLPKIPFGKYKDCEYIEFLSDKKYVEWCLSKPELAKKYKKIFHVDETLNL